MIDVYSPTILANMNNNTSLILKKTTSVKMWVRVNTEVNRIQPKHIKNVMSKFQEVPDPSQPIGVHLNNKSIKHKNQSTQGYYRVNH